MKSFKVYFQGQDKNGVTIFKPLKLEMVRWDPLKVIKDFEKTTGLTQVQINSYYEVTKTKRSKY